MKTRFIPTVLDIMSKRQNPDYNFDIIKLVFQEITKEPANYLDVPGSSQHLGMSTDFLEKDADKIVKLFKKILKTYDLSPSNTFLNITHGNKYFTTDKIENGEITENCDICEKFNTLLGEDLVIILRDISPSDNSKLSVTWVGQIFYTEKSKNIAKEIWIEYSKLAKEIFKLTIQEGMKKDIYKIKTVMVNQYGEYILAPLQINSTVSLGSEDFLDNYNTEFPENKIKSFLKMDKGGIMIFNGKPGCGKSTYIKHLILNNKDTRFVLLPQYLLLGQDKFRTFLLSEGQKDYIFIVEDCEKLLIKREENGATFSSVIGDVLNYTDGIYGDLTRTKFIFTFNTDLDNIDGAILRRGRLKLKYEFGPLTGENLEKIATKTGYKLTEEDKKNGVTLADLYSDVENIIIEESEKPQKRIGFLQDEE